VLLRRSAVRSGFAKHVSAVTHDPYDDAVETMALSKGQNVVLDTDVTRFQVVVGWSDSGGEREVDLTALLLGSSGRVRGDEDMVFYNQPVSADGAVHYLGATSSEDGMQSRVVVDLEVLDAEVSTIALVASLDAGSFGELGKLNLTLLDSSGQSALKFDIVDASVETAFHFGELYRRDAAWRFRAVAQGWVSGLAGLATDFGITIDSETTPEEDEATPEAAPAPVADLEPQLDADLAAAAEPAGVDTFAVAAPTDEALVASETDLVDVVEDPALTVGATAVSVMPAPIEEADVQARTVEIQASPVEIKAPVRRATGVRTRKAHPVVKVVPVLKLAGNASWQAARLFSISGVGAAEEQEKRATSTLLSTMLAVRPFARGITSRFGAPAGTVETFLEVGFPLGERTVIPDGVIRVARAGRVWTALVETKTGTGQLRRDQVENYLDVARQQGFDAVITLSNEIAPTAGKHPVTVDPRKLRKVELHHISWAEVLHEARMVVAHKGADNPLQLWITAELIRYLEHARSGAVAFDDMGPAWVPVREAIATGTLRASDRKVPAVAEAWARLVRHLCLHLTADLGVTVTQVMPRKLATDPAERTKAVAARLAAEGVLEATLRIPDAIGPVAVIADLRAGQVRASVDVLAPAQGTGTRRLAWLLRQLKDAPDALLVEVLFEGTSDTTCEQLVHVRTKTSTLLPDRSAEVSAFRLTLVAPLGTKRSGIRGAFISSVTTTVEALYTSAVQPLRAWVAPAPHLPDDVPAVQDTDESELAKAK
jgi:stress response protein SCP2